MGPLCCGEFRKRLKRSPASGVAPPHFSQATATFPTSQRETDISLLFRTLLSDVYQVLQQSYLGDMANQEAEQERGSSRSRHYKNFGEVDIRWPTALWLLTAASQNGEYLIRRSMSRSSEVSSV